MMCEQFYPVMRTPIGARAVVRHAVARSLTRRPQWLLAGMLVAVGCEPSVDIAQNQRSFDQLVVIGAVSDPLACAEGADDSSPSLQFALLDRQHRAIRPGSDLLVNEPIVLNETLTADDLTLEGGSRLFPSPDIPCGDLPQGAACPLPAYANAGFTCQPLESGVVAGAALVCARDVEVAIDRNAPLVFVDEQPIDVVVLAAAGDSVFGVDPCRSITPGWASDPAADRLRAFWRLADTLANGAGAGDISFCAASYREAGTLRLVGGEGAEAADCFLPVSSSGAFGTQTPEVTTAIGELAGASLDRGGNNYLHALDELIAIHAALEREAALHVVLFTDGALQSADESENEARGLTAARVGESAREAGATVHVVQLDHRPPMGRGVPDGNLAELQRLACATGGTHRYSRQPGELPPHAAALGGILPYHYRAQLSVSSLSEVPIGAYALEATVAVRVGDVGRAFPASASAGLAGGTFDNRISVHRRAGCSDDSAAACQPGARCVDGACRPDLSGLPELFPPALVNDSAVLDCLDHVDLCVTDCAPEEECVVLDVGSLPQDARVAACIDTAVQTP